MEIENLDNENNKLSDLIEYFETEEYVESISREKLGYKKPGEKIIVFTEEDSNNILNTENKEEKFEDAANIKLWWNYFFNNNDV